MSEQTKNEAQLSDEQLNEVSGGLNERFEEAREGIINKAKEEGELGDDQLSNVAGGLSQRFEEAREETINQLNDTFQDAHRDNLDR